MEEEFDDDDPRLAGLGPLGRKLKIRQIQEEQRERAQKQPSARATQPQKQSPATDPAK